MAAVFTKRKPANLAEVLLVAESCAQRDGKVLQVSRPASN